MAENNLLTRLDGLVGKYEEIELLITEHPVTNRARAGFDTALGVAWHAATLLNGDTFLFERITHLLNEDGTFQAVVSLRY